MDSSMTLPWDSAFGPPVTQASRRIAALHRAAASALRVHDAGQVDVDRAGLEAAIDTFSQDEQVRRRLRGHADALVADGAAMIPPGDLGITVPVPWATLEYWLTQGSPTACGLLLDHALAGARVRPAELANLLPDLYPNIPDRFLTPPRLFTLAMMMWDRDNYEGKVGGSGSGGSTGGYNKPAGSATTWGDAQPMADIIDCFAQGDWTVNFWGFSVCLDYFCAIKVADALQVVTAFVLPGPKGSALGAWAILLLKLGAIATTVMFIIWLYALVLSWNIRWVMTGKGVCIGANWPTPFVGTYVFAYPR